MTKLLTLSQKIGHRLPNSVRFALTLLIACSIATFLPAGSTSAADKFYDAERSAKDFLYYYEDFMKLERSELRDLVTAIFEAEEEERRSIASDVSSRVRDKVRYEYDKMDRRRVEALSLLESVMKDEAFKDKHDAARDLKRQVEEKAVTMDRMYDKVRGSNHPVVAFMIETGKEAHTQRQGRCTVAEFDTGDGRADCINPCEIVEFKPDNSRARNHGNGQLSKYYNAILSNPSKREELNNRHSDFKKCEKFEKRMECYTLRPEIDDEGNYRSTSVSWNSCS